MSDVRPVADSEGASAAAIGTLSPLEGATARVRTEGGSLTEGELDALLEQAGWPAEWRATGKRIALCEDPSLDPTATGDHGVSVGLFQIGLARPGWDGWFKHFGVAEALATDPLTNARVALLIRQERGRFGGLGGWSCAGGDE